MEDLLFITPQYTPLPACTPQNNTSELNILFLPQLYVLLPAPDPYISYFRCLSCTIVYHIFSNLLYHITLLILSINLLNLVLQNFRIGDVVVISLPR